MKFKIIKHKTGILLSIFWVLSLALSCTEEQEKENDQKAKGYLTCPNNNHPHAIDLGLNSGTKWACCNVGAKSPEEYGDYFAWGVTKPTEKDHVEYVDYDNIGYKDIAGSRYDAATTNWGSNWHMPSLTQMEELIDNTLRVWTSKNGVYGVMITGKNGGSIFLPATGLWENAGATVVDYWPAGVYGDGESGHYWSSTSVFLGQIYYLSFDKDYSSPTLDDFDTNYAGYDYFCASIRPVR